jgi:hypothetical protein
VLEWTLTGADVPAYLRGLPPTTMPRVALNNAGVLAGKPANSERKPEQAPMTGGLTAPLRFNFEAGPSRSRGSHRKAQLEKPHPTGQEKHHKFLQILYL